MEKSEPNTVTFRVCKAKKFNREKLDFEKKVSQTLLLFGYVRYFNRKIYKNILKI